MKESRRNYFFTKDGELYDQLFEMGIQPCAEIPVYTLDDGYCDGIWAYKKSEALLEAIMDIVKQRTYESLNCDYDDDEGIDYWGVEAVEESKPVRTY